jgi:DNA replication protein DnaC
MRPQDQQDHNAPSPDSRRHSVLFTTAVDIINTLAVAQTVGRLKHELRRYLKPAILAVDELGYLPIDKAGADLLFRASRAGRRRPGSLSPLRFWRGSYGLSMARSSFQSCPVWFHARN